MYNVFLVGRLDIAEFVFYLFVLFFIALIFYLRREDRREGYPLEDEITGRVDSALGPFSTSPYKVFKLPFDRGIAVNPTQGREPLDIAARRIARFGGAPYTPTGNPLVDGVGPAAYAQRSNVPDLDMDGHLRIVPISTDPSYSIASRDPDPRGMMVVAADDRIVGPVVDLWVDRAERLIRYYEVDVAGTGTALIPFGFAVVKRSSRTLDVDLLSADQYLGVPKPATPGVITRLEEERIQAYFGGGALYGLPGRTEPLV